MMLFESSFDIIKIFTCQNLVNSLKFFKSLHETEVRRFTHQSVKFHQISEYDKIFSLYAEATACRPWQVNCPGTTICIDPTWKCDGDNDCGNGWDESDCGEFSVPVLTCSGHEGRSSVRCVVKYAVTPDMVGLHVKDI